MKLFFLGFLAGAAALLIGNATYATMTTPVGAIRPVVQQVKLPRTVVVDEQQRDLVWL